MADAEQLKSVDMSDEFIVNAIFVLAGDHRTLPLAQTGFLQRCDFVFLSRERQQLYHC